MQISAYYIKRPDGFFSLSPSESQVGNGAPPSQGALLLYPFRTASIHPFSFPFRSAGDVRNALALRFRPLMSGEEEVEVAPLFTGRTKGGSEGAALCIWSGEIPVEGEGPPLQDNLVWPLPLALAGAVGGDGAAVYRDDHVCAWALFKEGMPLFIRCRTPAPDDGGVYGSAKRLQALAASMGVEVALEDVWRSTDSGELLESARETVRQFPRLAELNISRQALALSLARERTARIFLKFLGRVAVAGLFMCVIQYSLLLQLRTSIESYAAEGAALYREVFGQGERVVDPLSQAREKLAALRGQGKTESGFSRVLSHLGRTWYDGEHRKEDFPLLEQLRYTGEGADVTGTAEKMESIQALRSAADSGGFRATLGDIQQIPGGGLRFTLSLRGSRQ